MPVPDEIWDRLRRLEGEVQTHVAECTLLRETQRDTNAKVNKLHDLSIRWGAIVLVVGSLLHVVTIISAVVAAMK